MALKKLKTMASMVGYVGLILLAIQGGLATLNGDGAWAAPLFQGETVPRYINYQGTLRDGDGNPLDGTYTMTFRIYNDIIDPIDAALYEQELTDVTVRNGYFSVTLGELSPGVFNSPDRFVGVQVDPFEEMVPRQRFVSVAYAYLADEAQNADLFDGRDSNSFADERYEYSLRARDGSPSSALSVDNSGEVGIGTTSPQYKLDVTQRMRVRGSTGSQTAGIWFSQGTRNHAFTGLRNSNQIGFWGNNGVGWGLVMNTDNGRVGVGTSSPSQRLDVNGTTNVRGDFYLDNQKPIFFRRFPLPVKSRGQQPHFHSTGISSEEYECGIAGFAALRSDFQEHNTGDLIIVETQPINKVWNIKTQIRVHRSDPIWWITLICVDTEMAYRRGF